MDKEDALEMIDTITWDGVGYSDDMMTKLRTHIEQLHDRLAQYEKPCGECEGNGYPIEVKTVWQGDEPQQEPVLKSGAPCPTCHDNGLPAGRVPRYLLPEWFVNKWNTAHGVIQIGDNNEIELACGDDDAEWGYTMTIAKLTCINDDMWEVEVVE